MYVIIMLLGLWLLRKGQFCQSRTLFAGGSEDIDCKISRLILDDWRAFCINLGLSLKYQGRFAEAYDCFINLVGTRHGKT